MKSFTPRRVGYAVAGAATVVAGGAVGFHESLHETWVQSFYRAIVTATLAGLDTVPPNNASRAISIVLVLAGLTIFAYVASILVEGIAQGVFTGALAERRRRRTMERLNEHYIICGYGRVGRRVAAEFRESGIEYVVLDFSLDAIEAAREAGDLFIEGTGTEDEDLLAAGLERARGLVASSDSDADNLYITLSARAARPNLLIVARASDEDAAKKLRLAGADRVVQPYVTAGREMAALVLKPQVVALIDAMTSTGAGDLQYEEIEVAAASGQAGKTIRALRIRHETGAVIVAVRRRDGVFDTTPDPDDVLEAGDVMIAAGSSRDLRLLEALFEPRETVGG